MSLRYRTIGFAEHLDLETLCADDRDSLHLLRACGRGVQVDVPHGWLSLWLPLSGHLRLDSPDSGWEIGPRHVQIWREGRLRCNAYLPCWWLGLAGPLQAWTQPLRAVYPQQQLEILPWDGPVPTELRRLLVRLFRHASSETSPQSEAQLQAVCAAIVEFQHDLRQLLQRCSGRTLRRRQQTLRRLLRVQHLIRHANGERMDLARLAHGASYSPCHLIRLYREVFEETPSEYAARVRQQRAWQLVRDTAMPVCEITEMLGFESQSAFCRSFKNTFGVTTGEARRAFVRTDHGCAKAA